MLTMEESPTALDSPARKGRRRTKILVFAGVGVAALGATIAIDLAMSSTSHATTHFQQPIVLVDANVDSGSVRIVGSDQPEITIDASVHSGLRGPTHSETVIGNRLVIRSNCPFDLITLTCAVDYVIHVPSHVAVKARGNGSDLDFASISGDVDASVNGGRVNIVFVAAPHHVKAESNGGHVSIRVPDDSTGYRVDTHTNGGSTDVAIRTDPASDRTIKVETNGGDIDVRYVGDGTA